MCGRWRTLCAAVAVAAAAAAAWRGAAAQARPPRCPPRAARADCSVYRNDTQPYEFFVQGKYFSIEYVDGKSVSLRCEAGGPSLESAALPAFQSPLEVEAVAVRGCAPAPYAAVLRALNVTLAPRLNLTVDGAGGAGAPPLSAAHLASIAGALRSLALRAAGAPRAPLLAQLPALVALHVTGTRLAAGELRAPPAALEHVYLADAAVDRVPAALLALPRLRYLTVMGEGAVRVERADGSALRHLVLSGPDAALLSEWAPPALEGAYLARWAAEAPAPVPACGSLATLTLVEPAARWLPPGWVARCPRLATLEVRFATRLAALPARLLANATSLRRLALREGALASLPPDLFDETPLLAHLDLSGNRLRELPSGAVGRASRSLLELDLSGNELTSGVGAALVPLTLLRKLSLANNRHITDLCKVHPQLYITYVKNRSPLGALSRLEVLNLKNTNVTVICSDWRLELPLLADLDLRGTNVASLAYEDLKYTRHVRSVVRLQGAPLHDLVFTADDYDEAARAPPANVTVELTAGAGVVCDCTLYWFARAVEEGVLPVSGAGALRCAGAGGGVLRATRAADLLCAAPAGACPAPLPRGCACGAAGGLRSERALLQLRCVAANLTRVPRLPPLDGGAIAAVDLLLPDNTIAALLVDDIPPLLRVLDLRNNSIARIEEATASALVGRGERRVRLAGNPLDCSCRGAGSLRVLRARPHLLEGYEEGAVQCGDGRPLAAAPEAACAPVAPALAASLAGLAAAAALVGGALGARRAGAGRRLKTVLRRAGWGGEGAAGAGRGGRPYDAFVTFGRGDEAGALATAARLERGGRRVLLQERDWLPPAWVPHCVAVSVAAATVTVALLSPSWERWLENAEVRAALGDAWRGALVLVLPPGARAPLADAALRRYARDYPHLVLRRGDWRGLERALPPPPPPPPTT